MSTDQTPESPAEGLAKLTEQLAEQTETDLRSTSGTVRRRRRVVRGSAGLPLPDDDGPEFVRVRSSAEETRTVARAVPAAEAEHLEELEADSIEVDPTTDDADEPIIPDQVTATTGNSRTTAGPRAALDATSAALLLDAVHSYVDGYDRLGADHPVTLDRLDRLRRATALADGS